MYDLPPGLPNCCLAFSLYLGVNISLPGGHTPPCTHVYHPWLLLHHKADLTSGSKNSVDVS